MTSHNKNEPNYLDEVTNNATRARIYLGRSKTLDIACVYCVKFYRCFPQSTLQSVGDNTLLCDVCNVDSMVPIIPSSCLYRMDGDERLRQIKLWNEEWFTPIENDDGSNTGSEFDSEYVDYGYDGYEETKDATDPQEVDKVGDLEHGPDELFLPAIVPPEHIENI